MITRLPLQWTPAAVAAALMLCPAPAVSRQDPDAGKARVTVESPSRVFGGDKAQVSIDGKEKDGRVRKGPLGLRLEPGEYGVYQSGSAVCRAGLSLREGATVTIAFRPGAQAGLARLVVVEPQGVVNAKTITVSFGRRTRRAKLGDDSLSVLVAPGTYVIGSEGSAKGAATLEVEPDGVYYFVNRGDPRSHKVLGDKLYRDGNPSGALAHYSAALKIDSTATDLYRRYAELALRSGTTQEAEKALNWVIGARLADAETYRRLGDVRLEAKRYSEAAGLYEKALEEEPRNAAALGGLGAAKLKAGDAAGAVEACRSAVDIEPDSAGHYRTLGEALLALGDSTKAVAARRTFLDKGGSDGAVAFSVGAYEFGHRRFDDAARYLELVKGKRTRSFGYLRMLGESHYRLGNHKKAFPVLRLAANKYPRAKEWPDVVEMLITSYIGLKENKKAQYWVDKYAARSRQSSPDVAYYRAFLLERTSASKALALYERNIAAYPNDHRNYLRLGLMKSKSRKTLPESVELLKKAVSLADTIPEAWLEIARAYRQLNRPDDELAALRVFVASEPQHPEANARIGELMLREGKTGEALKQLEKATEAGADDPAILLALAQGYVRSGRLDEAVGALEKAKKSAPGDVEVHRRLADVYRRKAETVKAIAELKTVIELRRDNPTLLVYARLLYQQGSHGEAADAIEDIRATDPENTEALMLLGTILRAQGKYDEAVEVYREVAMIDPSTSAALRARADTHLEASQPIWAETFYERALRLDPHDALAVLGLAKVAKIRGDTAAYNSHLARARRMSPNDPEIKREYESGR